MERAAPVRLTLVRAENDEAAFSPNYQTELRQFYQLARAGDTPITAIAFTTNSTGAAGDLVGEFVMPLVDGMSRTFGAAAVAWLQGRAGRKLRLKVGDIEVEARNLEEIEQMLQSAQALQTSQNGDRNWA
ncbi:hypothetical protein [Paraburkholderia strydomiana]|uniref:hypothetical protein n=1 Tax=Paraburkholderia strydomiana TaxID=1245417 RepID=UPI001BEBDE8C|nr:hypothetical protein [Paraburkholderia strydomiana]MBT2793505.1 hypothetical protein [Paraburkholderia strydomiana]